MSAKISPEADALNRQIMDANPAVLEMLSERGKAIYFPKLGILSQSAEAKGKRINATIGIALEDDGKPMMLPGVKSQIGLEAKDSVQYAPSFGIPALREYWKKSLSAKNPSLAGKEFSLPAVANGITHAISIIGYLFLDKGDVVISPDYYWENYDLTLCNAFGAAIKTFRTFDGPGRDKFNIEGMKSKLLSKGDKKILLLNFPNNPSGYTPTAEESDKIILAIQEAADAGKKVIVISDDAYFGLAYEPGIMKESLFGRLSGLHKNALAVKADGATKEDFAWGLRIGFITFGIMGGNASLYGALENKTGGAIRGNISNASMLSQSLMLKAYQDPSYAQDKAAKTAILAERYSEAKKALAEHPEYKKAFSPLPFNSGYFMCLLLKNKSGEEVRKRLLTEFDTGLIAQGNLLRIAFSSLRKELIPEIFENVYKACL
ncbi:aminotransferase class I/II-fold pyridoxal phosphate-dependent enzyme [Candidatus Woesearchaeota archaeon]|nr:aminotransferase class I/II-fold pyridoxal phosphate-dependent enzyme [Candidatus Woesearchaeota archaeon]